MTTKLVSISRDSGLYFMEFGGRPGVCPLSFLEFNVQANAVAKWLKDKSLIPTAPMGTLEHFEQCNYALLMGRTFARATGQVCQSLLERKLIGLEGRFVQVVDALGNKRRFHVGRTISWLPRHTELPFARARHGAPVQNAPLASVRVIDN